MITPSSAGASTACSSGLRSTAARARTAPSSTAACAAVARARCHRPRRHPRRTPFLAWTCTSASAMRTQAAPLACSCRASRWRKGCAAMCGVTRTATAATSTPSRRGAPRGRCSHLALWARRRTTLRTLAAYAVRAIVPPCTRRAAPAPCSSSHGSLRIAAVLPVRGALGRWWRAQAAASPALATAVCAAPAIAEPLTARQPAAPAAAIRVDARRRAASGCGAAVAHATASARRHCVWPVHGDVGSGRCRACERR
mmetsp:Transcript_25494/g.65879  ORF Transcript_25494/g.65879 Transcript_25494/m.65879 type:complete len:255 (+) Transcript_25494:527-1291(+)